jgi:hypothetical protein
VYSRRHLIVSYFRSVFKYFFFLGWCIGSEVCYAVLWGKGRDHVVVYMACPEVTHACFCNFQSGIPSKGQSLVPRNLMHKRMLQSGLMSIS